MSEVALLVNGSRYGGWKSVRIVRSMESIAGSFDLSVSDRWGGQDLPWPIIEEDACQVQIDRVTVIDGYVDRRSISLAAESRDLSYSGRDRAAALVDNSAVLDKWTLRNQDALAICRTVAEPFGIRVTLQTGLVLPRPAPAKFVVSPGETAFEVIVRAARLAGVMVVSDGAGGIVLTRSGLTRAEALDEGRNIVAADASYDATQRFARYVVRTQVGGEDEASGDATRIQAEATDEEVRRSERVLLIQAEQGVSTEYARRRGDWEARLRAAQAETVGITVRGWKQTSGALWPINALTTVTAPALGVRGDMLISQVEHSIDEGGELSRLQLVRPDAFRPEPTATVKKSGSVWKGGLWNELARGV